VPFSGNKSIIIIIKKIVYFIAVGQSNEVTDLE
jgi:hypothetical protein